jgi:tetratricopeptide (TPR) repeat protein
MSVLDNSQTSDLFLLALASLKLERYVDAFETFQQLIEINPTNYLRYRDYLSMCETGYRIKYGDKIERALQGIQRLTEKGHLKEAAEALLQCKKDFVENELGKCYIERFSLTYKEIFRS